MPSLRSAACAAALALLASSARASDGSIRCDGGIVSVGDSKLDLVGKCGWPALQEDLVGERTATVFERRGQVAFNRSVTSRTERWTYDFGKNRFLQIVLLDGGRILRIERGGYGYGEAAAEPRPPIPRARCKDAVFHEGEGTYEIQARCGEPVFRESRADTRTRVVSDDPARAAQADSVTVTVEIWTYDFGPSAFVRHLTFEDGKLVRIDTGSYGYAR